MTGIWSAWTLVFLVAMLFIGIVLLVVLIITGFGGGFATKRAQPPTPSPGPVARQYQQALAEAAGLSYTPPQDVAPGQPVVQKRRLAGTGLFQLLGAMLAPLPALLVQRFVDASTGPNAGFSLGAGLNLLLLAGQVFLVVWYARLRRRSWPQTGSSVTP